MFKNFSGIKLIMIILISLIVQQNLIMSQIERFIPRQGGTSELWRITNNPAIRNDANYHNTDAWSPDGRYLCYQKYEPYDINPQSKVFIYDLNKGIEIALGDGKQPRWANNHNWLFYILEVPADGPPNEKGSRLMWLDVDNNKLTLLAYGVPNLGETDSDDRWIFGYKGRTADDRYGMGTRVPIRPDSRVEIIQGIPGWFWIPNPKYPSIMIRVADNASIPFKATRTLCDLEGNNIVIGSPQLQRCHQTWSGDGEYLLHGGTSGTLMCGRKWNEPFPSNLHVLSAIQCGDIGACGKSGRWICGNSSSDGDGIEVADLRSGDGWKNPQLTFFQVHDSYKYNYNDSRGGSDPDAKGSADGTKVVFHSTYDLKDGPLTEITEDGTPTTDRINVKSTEGFPAKGTLSIGNEIVGYSRKTASSFEGLSRNLYNTTGQSLDLVNARMMKEFSERKSDEEFLNKYPRSTFNKLKTIVEKIPTTIRKGQIITSFDAMLIPEALRKNMKLPTMFSRPEFPDDKNSPLLWQRRSDIYVVVVRLPDQPFLNKVTDGIELIPGENHWETYGYNIFKGGEKITKVPLRPGETFMLQSAGSYTASAIEWSGLESKKSFPLQVEANTKLNVRLDKPTDFSWISERWLADGKEVPKESALNSVEAVKEITHLIDGVIHREWYNWGQIMKKYDLIPDGKAARRLYYENGKLAMREYYHLGINMTSREIFDNDGKFITESIQYQTLDDGTPREVHHFWYKDGCPVKFVGSGGRHAADAGTGMYEKEGEVWAKRKSFF